MKSLTNNKITIALEALALVAAIITPVIFIVGHIAAYFYFSSFNIQYFKYTDSYTAFSFALESMDVVLSVIAIGVIAVYILITAIRFLHNSESSSFNDLLRINKYKPMFIMEFVILPIAMIFLFINIINSSSEIIVSSALKEDIKDNRYIPLEISFNQGNNIYKCVTSIGTIGQFQAFITQTSQPILIQKSSLIYIKQMFSSPPLRVLPMGKTHVVNHNFDEEMMKWSLKWNEVCGSPKDNDFEIFKFTKSRHESNK